jgi:cytochrome d ubiquinol oxidase subunit II
MLIFWVSILALGILLYGLLCEFDLGIAILFGFTREKGGQSASRSTVAPIPDGKPILDGNEMRLIVAGVVVCVVFPVVYATVLSAVYLPFLLMLAGLILRGVASEHRSTERLRWVWDAAFSGGSLVAAFMQGLMVGALIQGLVISRSKYTGDEFSWWSLFAAMCGAGGLCIGYALLGVSWLMRKYQGDVRTAAYRFVTTLSLGSLLALVFAFVYSMAANLRLLTH